MDVEIGRQTNQYKYKMKKQPEKKLSIVYPKTVKNEKLLKVYLNKQKKDGGKS